MKWFRQGALDRATPQAARVYEDTGNEGATLELQYRHAALVTWRRNEATLTMLARCGGRAAIAVELAERLARLRSEHGGKTGPKDVITLWREALHTDGGGVENQAHRIVLDAIDEEWDENVREDLRNAYVEGVASIDLDAEAVPTLMRWIRERLKADKSTKRMGARASPGVQEMALAQHNGRSAGAATRTVRERTNRRVRHRSCE